MATSTDFGKKGEKFVAHFLEENLQYKIISLNEQCSIYGEIDIVAKDKFGLVFVEVKSRSSDKFMDIFESVDKRKKSALMRAVTYYINSKGYENYRYRIDLATLNTNTKKVEYYEDICN
ncbi:YraN family protein [Patescibacteria group bacterium]|nr:YraN family protein [Patescibacteria group bacterium]